MEVLATLALTFFTATEWGVFGQLIIIALVSFFYYGKNGKKNKFLQYFFYVFYPLHLLLIDIVLLIANA